MLEERTDSEAVEKKRQEDHFLLPARDYRDIVLRESRRSSSRGPPLPPRRRSGEAWNIIYLHLLPLPDGRICSPFRSLIPRKRLTHGESHAEDWSQK